MRQHQDWRSPGFEFPALAEATGPFATSGFLSTIWEAWSETSAELVIAESADSLVCLEVVDDGVRPVGHRDLVDYRTPLGGMAGSLFGETLDSLPAVARLAFDSLPESAASALADGARKRGWEVVVAPGDVAAVLTLPASFDEYLASIGKRERHELRRKRRRYEAAIGSLELVRVGGAGEFFDQFVSLHRRSGGDKGSFMTAPMAGYFRALLSLPGWGIEALIGIDGQVAAASFGYRDEDGYFLYNSAFDPDLGHISPGQVMLGMMIERAIAEGCSVFDFLKGDETYKFRLGATARPLYDIVGNR